MSDLEAAIEATRASLEAQDRTIASLEQQRQALVLHQAKGQPDAMLAEIREELHGALTIRTGMEADLQFLARTLQRQREAEGVQREAAAREALDADIREFEGRVREYAQRLHESVTTKLMPVLVGWQGDLAALQSRWYKRRRGHGVAEPPVGHRFCALKAALETLAKLGQD